MDPVDAALLRVEVIYGPRAGEFDAVALNLPAGATVHDALQASGVLARHAQIDLARDKVGVWGQWRALDHVLRDLDRVEVYRPLAIDPKEARRKRQREARVRP
jgi:uncharacterized protein